MGDITHKLTLSCLSCGAEIRVTRKEGQSFGEVDARTALLKSMHKRVNAETCAEAEFSTKKEAIA